MGHFTIQLMHPFEHMCDIGLCHKLTPLVDSVCITPC